jgi:hypothetical protein
MGGDDIAGFKSHASEIIAKDLSDVLQFPISESLIRRYIDQCRVVKPLLFYLKKIVTVVQFSLLSD